MVGRVTVLILLILAVAVGWLLDDGGAIQNLDPTASDSVNYWALWLFLAVMLAGAITAIRVSPKVLSHPTNYTKFGMIAGGIVVSPVGLALGLWIGPIGLWIAEVLLGDWARALGLTAGLFGIPFLVGLIGAMLGLGAITVASRIANLIR